MQKKINTLIDDETDQLQPSCENKIASKNTRITTKKNPVQSVIVDTLRFQIYINNYSVK